MVTNMLARDAEEGSTRSSRSATRSGVENRDMTALVPEIDIAPLLDGTQSTNRTVAEKIKTAGIDIGFFTVVGHGIDFGLLQTANAVGAVE